MKVYYKKGDTIAGDIIFGEARVISKPIVISKSGRHKAQRIKLKENVKCWIEKECRFIK
ncbi:MAG: hypothetical protein ACE5KE_08090 [Methanosarcinales archaeon]